MFLLVIKEPQGSLSKGDTNNRETAWIWKFNLNMFKNSFEMHEQTMDNYCFSLLNVPICDILVAA